MHQDHEKDLITKNFNCIPWGGGEVERKETYSSNIIWHFTYKLFCLWPAENDYFESAKHNGGLTVMKKVMKEEEWSAITWKFYEKHNTDNLFYLYICKNSRPPLKLCASATSRRHSITNE